MSEGEGCFVLSAEKKLIKLRKGKFTLHNGCTKDMISLLVSSVVSDLNGSTIKH